MFKSGATVFLNLPSNTKSGRALHRASVVDFSSGGLTIAMDESDVSVAAGKSALLFFERRQAFLQQPVRIDAVLTDNGEDTSEPFGNETGGGWSGPNGSTVEESTIQTTPESAVATRLLVGLQPTGEPISAEERSAYRIVTSIVGGVTVTLEDTIQCVVLDVSATGFSVITSAPLEPGQVVRASLHHQEKDYRGTAIVQSIKQLPGGKTRFGLHCAGEGGPNAQLRNGLQHISAAIQRQQLRRTSGNG